MPSLRRRYSPRTGTILGKADPPAATASLNTGQTCRNCLELLVRIKATACNDTATRHGLLVFALNHHTRREPIGLFLGCKARHFMLKQHDTSAVFKIFCHRFCHLNTDQWTVSAHWMHLFVVHNTSRCTMNSSQSPTVWLVFGNVLSLNP